MANAGNSPASACRPTAGAHLRVPPNQAQPIEVAFTGTGGAVSATHPLSVAAVAVGPGQTR